MRAFVGKGMIFFSPPHYLLLLTHEHVHECAHSLEHSSTWSCPLSSTKYTMIILLKKKNFNYKFGHNFIEVLFCVHLKYIN